MSTCTVEEKIIQRQLSKEGLQNIVDDKDQVNQFSSSELKSIFRRRKDVTCSDTHDTLRCKRCSNVRTLDPAAMEDMQK
jgi:DNA repair and recombination protein RAD54 and RAD54-like protein